MSGLDLIRDLYSRQASSHAAARERFGRGLTLAEKILVSHMQNFEDQGTERGSSYVDLHPDRVAMQDATAQMALLQFMQSGRPQVAVPSTVHCDHLIQARLGAETDLDAACDLNREVYAFLRSVSEKYGIGFWKPGAGIIHQVVLENYAFPGGMMIGTDSHTPNAGGLGMIAVGVGGADAVDVMAGMPWELKFPKLIGVHLIGELNGWASPKDVILTILGQLSTKGGTGCIVEYFGDGAKSLSCTGKATITNMGAELGATTSLFHFDESMACYLETTDRAGVAELARAHASELRADEEVMANPSAYFDQVVEIDLSTLEPFIVGPHSPDLARPISAFRAEIEEKGYPHKISATLIGSCTNSSYEDIGRSTHLARQGLANGVRAQMGFWVSPGSDKIYATMERDGQLSTFEDIGATVLANACGPCIGQWRRDDSTAGEPNSIVTSFNRNFRGRNDANPETLSFIAGPELTTAFALSGDLRFNPMTDDLTGADGNTFRLEAPTAPALPIEGFAESRDGYIPPAADGSGVVVEVDASSERLQILSPFDAWDGEEMIGLRVLLKAKGKCTTDHISPAGKWLKFRGHLDNISNNMFCGAVNAFTDEIGHGTNQLTNESAMEFSAIARSYKASGVGWVAVGDENYGEGSSREHAAMEPRHLGARAVIVRSFARIHETNLKKQGVLALTFTNAADYDLVRADDEIDIGGLVELEPESTVTATLRHADGTSDAFALNHTLNADQIRWWKAGSALNQLAGR